MNNALKTLFSKKSAAFALISVFAVGSTTVAAAKSSEYIAGERAAYVECLEALQRWRRANKIGLDYPIEVRFPLE